MTRFNQQWRDRETPPAKLRKRAACNFVYPHLPENAGSLEEVRRVGQNIS